MKYPKQCLHKTIKFETNATDLLYIFIEVPRTALEL